jgi:hypothetical protein
MLIAVGILIVFVVGLLAGQNITHNSPTITQARP